MFPKITILGLVIWRRILNIDIPTYNNSGIAFVRNAYKCQQNKKRQSAYTMVHVPVPVLGTNKTSWNY